MEPYTHVGVGTPPVHEEERPDHTCDDCELRRAWKQYEMQRNFNDNWSGLHFNAVPGGASGPRMGGETPMESQKRFDQDLDSYREAKKHGLKPEQSTKKAVEKAEQRAESFDRVATKASKGMYKLGDGLEKTMKDAM